MARKLTVAEIVTRARVVHNTCDYDYSRLQEEYKTTATKVTIQCRKHGLFTMTMNDHVNGKRGCAACDGRKLNRASASQRDSLALEKAKKIHGSKYEYLGIRREAGSKPTIRIKCQKHGVFEQRLSAHVGGQGCDKCADATWRVPEGVRLRKAIAKATKLHSGKYDYTLIKQGTKHATIVTIVCPAHGKFKQKWGAHLIGRGCRKCGNEKISLARGGPVADRVEQFLADAKRMHGDEYAYPNIHEEYVNTGSVVTVVCPTCGPREQIAGKHARRGYGCGSCNRSAGEKSISRLMRDMLPDEVIDGSRKVIPPFELDVYAPNHKLAIEYCGVYWHSRKDKSYHADKQKACAQQGIRLFTIFENEWLDEVKQKVLVSRIESAVGKASLTVAARKCQLVQLDRRDAAEFFNGNHLSGHVNAKVYIGLQHEGDVVAAMSFGRPRFSNSAEWELLRSCSKLGVSVPGGVSRLLAFFKALESPSSILSYADLRFGDGAAYSHAGFVLKKRSDPSPWFTKTDTRTKLYHRSKVQKHKLAKLLPDFNPALTADANLEANNWVRVYDCGHNVWEWKAVQ